MRNSGILILFVIVLTILDWLVFLSDIEYWGMALFIALVSVLFQLEDIEEKL